MTGKEDIKVRRAVIDGAKVRVYDIPLGREVEEYMNRNFCWMTEVDRARAGEMGIYDIRYLRFINKKIQDLGGAVQETR